MTGVWAGILHAWSELCVCKLTCGTVIVIVIETLESMNKHTPFLKQEYEIHINIVIFMYHPQHIYFNRSSYICNIMIDNDR